MAMTGAVQAGFSRWLQGVRVEARLQAGRFRGWTVLSLYPKDPCYRQVDVRIGDVVTRVNGRSIERPEQALAIFTGLPSASALVIELLRDGQARTVNLSIVADR